jgi:hypothetical protein
MASQPSAGLSNEKPMNDYILEEAERLFEQAKPVPTISEYEREQKGRLDAANRRLLRLEGAAFTRADRGTHHS